jgi:hypothetical protein
MDGYPGEVYHLRKCGLVCSIILHCLRDGLWHVYSGRAAGLTMHACNRGVVKSKARGSVLPCNNLRLMERPILEINRTPSRFIAILEERRI